MPSHLCLVGALHCPCRSAPLEHSQSASNCNIKGKKGEFEIATTSTDTTADCKETATESIQPFDCMSPLSPLESPGHSWDIEVSLLGTALDQLCPDV